MPIFDVTSVSPAVSRENEWENEGSLSERLRVAFGCFSAALD